MDLSWLYEVARSQVLYLVYTMYRSIRITGVFVIPREAFYMSIFTTPRIDKSDSPVAWDNQEILVGTQSGNPGCPVTNCVFFVIPMKWHSNTTKFQSWATTLSAIVVWWTNGSENDLSTHECNLVTA